MIFRSVIAALLVFCAATPGLAQVGKRPVITASTPTPDDRARQWLVLVDDKNYSASWTQSGKSFQDRQKADAWAKDAAVRREPLGAVASRGLKSIDLSRSNVAVIRYDTVFAHKAAAVETVTLTFENGSWVVTDYSVT
jgi:endonuclease/exonuclease/phosphatase family metal-dependent hydrolase